MRSNSQTHLISKQEYSPGGESFLFEFGRHLANSKKDERRKPRFFVALGVSALLLVPTSANAQNATEPLGYRQCLQHAPSVPRIAKCLIVVYGVSVAIEIAEAYGLDEVVRYLRDLFYDEKGRQRDPSPITPR